VFTLSRERPTTIATHTVETGHTPLLDRFGSKVRWPALLAALLFLAISLPMTLIARNERSAWILMTSPIESSHQPNSFWGYSYNLGADPFHKENISFIYQVMNFHGIVQGPDLYFARPIYALAASLLAPLLGVIASLQFVNWLSWALAAWVSWRFAQALFSDDLAALLAVLLTAGGMGMISHIGDYSAHLMSFTFYYLGIYIIYSSGTWQRRVSLRTHLAIGVFLAFAAWQYNTGLALIIGYLLVSLRHNRLHHLILAGFIALTAQSVWTWSLQFSQEAMRGTPFPLDIYSAERAHLSVSLENWRWVLSQPFLGIPRIVNLLLEFALFDSPAVILLGTAAILLLRRGRALYWFFFVFASLPVAAGMLYGFSAGARGYIVFGISILLYVPLAGLVAQFIRRKKGVIALGLTVSVLILHFGWNTAFLWGNLGPLKIYFLGADNGLPVLSVGMSEVVSLTGLEVTPALFGGPGTLTDAGLRVSDAPPVSEASKPVDALLVRFIFIVYLLVLIGLLLPRPRPRFLLTGMIVLLVLLLLPAPLPLKYPPVDPQVDQAYLLDREDSIGYTLELSSTLRSTLPSYLDAESEIGLFTRVTYPSETPEVPVELYLDEQRIHLTRTVNPYFWGIDRAQFLPLLASSSQLTVRINALMDAVSVGGWQQIPLPGRTLSFSPARESTPVVPLIELRVLDARGVIRFAGF
jgi:hypothetical protein